MSKTVRSNGRRVTQVPSVLLSLAEALALIDETEARLERITAQIFDEGYGKNVGQAQAIVSGALTKLNAARVALDSRGWVLSK